MRFNTISFLGGYAKDRIYADKPSTFEYLKTNIRQVTAEIPPNICQKVVENYLKGVKADNNSRRVSHIMSTFKNNILYVFYLRLLSKPRSG